MNNMTFNSIKELLEWKKNIELSSEFIFNQYLDVIYSNLILREEISNQQNSVLKHRNSLEIKLNGNTLPAFRSNSIHRKSTHRSKNIDKGISLKTFLEYMNIQEFIGKRIFNYLNVSTLLKLNKSDFIQGLSKIYYSDISNLIKFTFFLSDFNNDGKIYRSDMKLILAYIPSFSEISQKLKIKQINKIINSFFDSNIKNSEDGSEKQIDLELYSKYVNDYNEDNKNVINSDLLNDFNYNAPFFYFISILSYLFKNCPFNKKNVDYFNYYKKMRIKLRNSTSRSSSLKKEFVTTAKKSENMSNSNNNLLDFSVNAPLTIRQESKKISIVAIPKIGQKNLFKARRSTSQKNVICENNNEKFINLINNKKKEKENFKNKDYIISKDKNDVKSKKKKEVNLFQNKLKKVKQNSPGFPDISLNIRKKMSSTLLNVNRDKNEFSQSPQLLIKQVSNEESFSNKGSNNALIDMRYSSSKTKIKLPSISKEKLSPMSVGFKLKQEDKDCEDPGEFVLCECSGSEEETKNDLNEEEVNNDSNEVFLYKMCDDVNNNQNILNKFYAVLSQKEILFFSSEYKNELCDLWYIYKGHISTGTEKYKNTNYFIINITFFSNNYVNKLYFLKEDICLCFAKKIQESIKDLAFNDYYELNDKLGQGHFGTVNKCTKKVSGEIYAVKIIDKDKLKANDLDLIHQEKNYLSLIKHPNILSLIDYFEDKKNIYLITECCNGGDLLTFIEKNNNQISEKTTAKIIRKIAEGLKYLNFFGIVHRDIKPENILFSDINDIKTLKIIDLGVCQTLTYGEMASEPIGTSGYISPEIYSHEKYSFKTDIWSLGIILYLLITEGILPFDNEDMDYRIIGKKVLCLQQEYPEEYFGNKSKGLINLLDKMLEKSENKRIDINNLLKDSWFNIIKT